MRHDYKDTILRIENYDNEKSFMSYSYITKRGNGWGCGPLMEDRGVPLLNKSLMDLLIQTARFEISPDISDNNQLIIKSLMGLN